MANLNPDHKFKLLDCDRTAILHLPSAAVHLWLTYYMHELNGDESWLSIRRISIITGMDTKTVMKWQRYLKELGWLVETGETAADKYGSKATRGSNKVKVVRVDDPTKRTVGNIPRVNLSSDTEQITVGKSPTPLDSYKGSSLLCSGSPHVFSAPLFSGLRYSAKEKYQPKGELQNHGENLEPKPKTKSKGELKFEQEHGGISRALWDSHDEAWKAQKCIDLGRSQPGISKLNGNGDGPNVPGPKKEKSKHGLMEFLNEGNPVRITDEKWRSLMNKEDLDEL
jgi:hypothetical protein